MTISEAREIANHAPNVLLCARGQHLASWMEASMLLCESRDATLQDLVACAAIPWRSAAWRPAAMIYERTLGEPELDDDGNVRINLKRLKELINQRNRP